MLALIEWHEIATEGLPPPATDVLFTFDDDDGEEAEMPGYIDPAGIWHFVNETVCPWPVVAWAEYPLGPRALRALAGELPLTPHASPLTETSHG